MTKSKRARNRPRKYKAAVCDTATTTIVEVFQKPLTASEVMEYLRGRYKMHAAGDFLLR